MKRLIYVLLLLWLSTGLAVAQVESQTTPVREEAEQARLLQEGTELIRTGKVQDAIPVLEKVISYYESKYPLGTIKVYCASNQVEALYYLVKHSAQVPKTDAQVVRFWCHAQFFKGYALVELGRIADAQVALEAAVALSPANSQYLSELGGTYIRQKNWVKALEIYTNAEEAVQFSEPQVKQRHLAVAHRGAGYALIELDRLDEAEAKYRQSIQLDPTGKLAVNQLEYIRQLRLKRGTQ